MQRFSGHKECPSIILFCYCCNICKKRVLIPSSVEARRREVCGNGVISATSFRSNRRLRSFTFDSSYINHIYWLRALDGRLLEKKMWSGKCSYTEKKRGQVTEEEECFHMKESTVLSHSCYRASLNAIQLCRCPHWNIPLPHVVQFMGRSDREIDEL